MMLRVVTIALGERYVAMAASLATALRGVGVQLETLTPETNQHWADCKLQTLARAMAPTLWLDADLILNNPPPFRELRNIRTMAAAEAAYTVARNWTNTGLVYTPGTAETGKKLERLRSIQPPMCEPYWDELVINRMPLHVLPMNWCDTRPSPGSGAYFWHPYRDRKLTLKRND